jgi:Protein of unknown function (DUF2442)
MGVKPIEVKALEPYKVWVKYSDGVEGVIDYSHFAGKGVFKKWEDPEFFKNVFIVDDWRCISWADELEMDPETTYHLVSGLSIDEASKKMFG